MTLENSHPREPFNFYPEPPSASDALFRSGLIQRGALVYDPACGCGTIPRMAGDAGFFGYGEDVRSTRDFLTRTDRLVDGTTVVTNPPYGPKDHRTGGLRLEEAFIKKALALGAVEVYALLPLPWMGARTEWLRSQGWTGLFILRPRLSILSFAAMKAGQWPGGGGKDYAWYRFAPPAVRHHAQTRFAGVVVDDLQRNVDLDTRENWTWWDR